MMPVSSPELMLAELSKRPGLRLIMDLLAAGSSPGSRVLLIGGAVRDVLLGRPDSVDIDLVVEGSLEPVLALLEGGSRPYPRFGTVTLDLGELRVDLAEARTETYAQPGALPQVRPATVEQDLGRRDLTINAIAVELTREPHGQVVAFPGALDDLEARRLAVLHDRSFIDDPTRLLRLVRYRSQLGFDTAPPTLALALAAIAGGALETVSGTRVGNELRLLAAEPDPVAALTTLSDLGLDTAIDPGFGLGRAGSDAARTLDAAVTALPPDGRRDLLALATALMSLSSTSLRALLDRLGFSAPDRDVILGAATTAPLIAEALTRAASPSQIAEVVGSSALEAIALASALSSGVSRQNALRWLGDLRHLVLAVSGVDLVAAGIRPGPAVGAGLNAARAALLDGDAPDRDRQLQVALAVARAELG